FDAALRIWIELVNIVWSDLVLLRNLGYGLTFCDGMPGLCDRKRATKQKSKYQYSVHSAIDFHSLLIKINRQLAVLMVNICPTCNPFIKACSFCVLISSTATLYFCDKLYNVSP